MSDTVPAFDFRRWGVGGIVMVGVLLASGLTAFVEGLFRGSVGMQVIGTICLGGGVVILALKFGEEIHPVTAKWSITREIGEVVKDLDGHTNGIVRVRSELWSAKSEAHIPLGAKVRVARVEGLTAWVVKIEDQPQVSTGVEGDRTKR
jgi:membrane protein implicated in regulation of membrane protease activity